MLKLWLLLTLATIANGANILFFFGLSTYSHRITVWPLAEKLAEKGHKVTFVQPFKPKKPNPNITEFFPEGMEQVREEFEKLDFLNLRLAHGRDGIMNMIKRLPELGLQICTAFLNSSDTQTWIKKSKFDLIVIDALMNECGYGLAHIFKSKTIIFGTTHPFIWWYDSFGIVPESSWIPETHMAYSYPMSFFERVISTIVPLLIHYDKQTSFYPALGKVFKEVLNLPEEPSMFELERKTSLIFTNTHYSEELARSLPPLIVPIGGMHCEDSSQTLTPELKKFIDESGDAGFMYVSFGSAAKISQAPEEFRNMFYKAMANSKLRFVWKYEGERTDAIPSNVFLGSWMPQQAILAHPKIKAFFTHGGLLGIQEAVWHGVPLLVMPIFAEQDYNAVRVQGTQRGLMLDPNTITPEKLENAIKTIVADPKYKKNMKDLQRMFKDRPDKPVDTAVWWTEYVLRHEDLSSLKPLGIHQTWYERRLLDVWGFLFLLLLTALVVILFVVKKVLSFCLSSRSSDATGSSNQRKSRRKKNN